MTATEARREAFLGWLLSKAEPLTCAHCERVASCFGAYEDESNLGPACDECCGCGNEDGWCVLIEELRGAGTSKEGKVE